MLLFDDYWKRTFEILKKIFPGLKENDLALDRSGHGDFTLRSFQIMKDQKVSIDDISRQVADVLKKEDFIEKIEPVGGYINFTIRRDKMMQAMKKEIDSTGLYPDTFQDPERVSVEHTSTNPTGPIHIGRIRNSILGDSLARLISRYGYRVTTQYFINDSGKQVATLFAGYRKYIKDSTPNVNDLLDGYKKVNDALENDHSLQEEVDEIIRQYERGDPDTIRNIRMICTVILNSINESLSRIGIKIDDYTWESDLIRAGDVERVLKSLDDKLQEEDGAKYITSLDRKMFLTRSDGTSLYFSRDIAYHLYKSQNFDWLINVLGENHKEHMKHLEYVLKDLMEIERRLDFVYYSYVSLESGRMSTRKGNMVTLDELVERAMEESMKVVKEKRPDLPIDKLNEIADSVAISAIRFQLVKLNANKTLVFKWSEALSLEGDSAPFIMYSYARAASILRKLEEPETAISQEYDGSESALIRQMYFYPYALEEAFRGLKPESVANYLLELTRKFNDFYTNCPVVNAKEKDRSKRVLIIHLYKNIVKDASNIMGIKILEEM